jgi:hypothetical protein
MYRAELINKIINLKLKINNAHREKYGEIR